MSTDWRRENEERIIGGTSLTNVQPSMARPAPPGNFDPIERPASYLYNTQPFLFPWVRSIFRIYRAYATPDATRITALCCQPSPFEHLAACSGE